MQSRLDVQFEEAVLYEEEKQSSLCSEVTILLTDQQGV